MGKPEELKPKDGSGGNDPNEGGRTLRWISTASAAATRASTSDPESRMARNGNGKEAKLSYADT